MKWKKLEGEGARQSEDTGKGREECGGYKEGE